MLPHVGGGSALAPESSAVLVGVPAKQFGRAIFRLGPEAPGLPPRGYARAKRGARRLGFVPGRGERSETRRA
jgi:hypothetical protein